MGFEGTSGVWTAGPAREVKRKVGRVSGPLSESRVKLTCPTCTWNALQMGTINPGDSRFLACKAFRFNLHVVV